MLPPKPVSSMTDY